MKRYWFITISFYSQQKEGVQNMGFVSDDKNPFNNKTIKKEVLRLRPEFTDSDLCVTFFYEFKTEKDYVDFWS